MDLALCFFYIQPNLSALKVQLGNILSFCLAYKEEHAIEGSIVGTGSWYLHTGHTFMPVDVPFSSGSGHLPSALTTI